MDGFWKIKEDERANRLQVIMPFQTKEGIKNRIIYSGNKPLSVDIAALVIEHNNEIAKKNVEIMQLENEMVRKFVE